MEGCWDRSNAAVCCVEQVQFPSPRGCFILLAGLVSSAKQPREGGEDGDVELAAGHFPMVEELVRGGCGYPRRKAGGQFYTCINML